MCGCLFVCMHTCVYCEMAFTLFFFFCVRFLCVGIQHHDAATHTSPITAWVSSSSPLLVSDLVSWSVARSAIPMPPPSHSSLFSEKNECQSRCWSPLLSTCVRVTSEPREAFIAVCSSLLGSLVWVWDHNILFVTPSLIRANSLFLTSLHPPFHVSILSETWFPEWMFFRHSLEVLNVLAKDTSGLSFW